MTRMTATERDQAIRAAARSLVASGNGPTQANIARWSDGRSADPRVRHFTDTDFSRFCGQVAREVAAMLQEQDDIAEALR
jgi:hypothetical protein